ncbi:hypothetical protein AWJ14_11675 [Hoeflea olei]|uniref:Uncharacterized protein n=2 Tax=Hoeflea olei TaxID=1480615 RepID=A0A1C1YR89_9HYPH|nr:hypothetical protein AWJ14_11675 [Hoeflea olei]
MTKDWAASDAAGRFSEVARDQDYADRMDFISACFELAKTHPAFAGIAGSDAPKTAVMAAALENASPVLAALGDSLDAHIQDLALWNIRAAGKNEVISRDIERNWMELKKLGWIDQSA